MGKKKYNGTRNSSNAEYKAISGGAKALSPEIIKESGDKAQTKNQTKISEEKAKYDSCHNNILWIDDMDSKDAGSDDEKYRKITWMKQFLETDNDAYYINLINKFSDAVDEIVKNCNQYDLVVFDMNLSKCPDISKLKDKKIGDVFKKYNLIFIDDNSLEYGGLYLYLLLLSVGYPINRMVFYSANMEFVFNNDNNEEIQKLIKAFFNFNEKGIYFQKKSKKNLNIEQYYPDGDNSYYRIRRLVFQACEYWKKQDILNVTKNDEENEVPFNKLYFNKQETKKNKIEKESFLEMLDHIEMLFPVKEPPTPKKSSEEPSKESSEESSEKPSGVEKVYYQAAKTLCMFHEESANIKGIKDTKKYKKYHQVSRYFRNWSAHNKIDTLEMKPELFALLFCITLRTYFDVKQTPTQTNTQNRIVFSGLYDYEKLYYLVNDNVSVQPTNNLEHIFNKLVKDLNNDYSNDIINEITSQYKVSDVTYKSQNIDSLIRTYGEAKVKEIPRRFLLYGTVFDTVGATIKYDMHIEGKELSIPQRDNNKWFSLKNENDSTPDNNNNTVYTNLKEYIFPENDSDENPSEFEKLVFNQAYKILYRDSAPDSAQTEADNSNTAENV